MPIAESLRLAEARALIYYVYFTASSRRASDICHFSFNSHEYDSNFNIRAKDAIDCQIEPAQYPSTSTFNLFEATPSTGVTKLHAAIDFSSRLSISFLTLFLTPTPHHLLAHVFRQQANSFFLCHISSIRNMSYPSPSLSFQSLFDLALQDYEKQTGTKLVDHPLAKQLETCDSVESITAFFQQQTRAFREFRGDDGKVMKSLKCAVHVLYMLAASSALGEGIGLVRSVAARRTWDFPVFDTHPAIPAGKSNIRRFCHPTLSTFLSASASPYTTSEHIYLAGCQGCQCEL